MINNGVCSSLFLAQIILVFHPSSHDSPISIQAAATSNLASLTKAATQTTASAGTTGSSAINTVASIEVCHLFPLAFFFYFLFFSKAS